MTTPSNDTTLAILLGASQWTMTQLESSEAFRHSSVRMQEYFLSADFFNLPRDNVLDLFDNADFGPIQIRTTGRWIAERTEALRACGKQVADVILYYVGHGGFIASSNDYYLAVQSTETDFEEATGIRAKDLIDCISRQAAFVRKFIILDCCFAGYAGTLFQAIKLTAAARQIVDRPTRGTALLCSSSGERPSKIVSDNSSTMFSGALHRVLTHGDGRLAPMLSFDDVSDWVWEFLKATYPDDAIRPECHAPDQSEGDLTRFRIFRNPAHRSTTRNLPVVVPARPQRKASEQSTADETARLRRPEEPVYQYIFSDDPLLLQEASQQAYGRALLTNLMLGRVLTASVPHVIDLHLAHGGLQRKPPTKEISTAVSNALKRRYMAARIYRRTISASDLLSLRNLTYVCDPSRTADRLGGAYKRHDLAISEAGRLGYPDRRLRIAAIGFRVKVSRIPALARLDEDLCPRPPHAKGMDVQILERAKGKSALESSGRDRWRDTIEAHLRASLERGSHIILAPEFGLPPDEPGSPDRIAKRLQSVAAAGADQDVFIFAGSRHDGEHNCGLLLSRRSGETAVPYWHYKVTSNKRLGENILGPSGVLFPSYPLELRLGQDEARIIDFMVAIGYDTFDPTVFLSLVLQSVYKRTNFHELIILVPAFNPSDELVELLRDLSFLAQCTVVYVNGLHGDAAMFISGFSLSDLTRQEYLKRKLDAKISELLGESDDLMRRLDEETAEFPVDETDIDHAKGRMRSVRDRIAHLRMLQATLKELTSVGALDDIITVERCDKCERDAHEDDYDCQTDILYYNVDTRLIEALAKFRSSYFADDSFLPEPFRMMNLTKFILETQSRVDHSDL
jgi:hypothetical protein